MQHYRSYALVVLAFVLISCWQEHAKPKQPPIDNLPPLEKGGGGPKVDLSGTWVTELPTRTKYLTLADSTYRVRVTHHKNKGALTKCEDGTYSVYGNKISFEGTRLLMRRSGEPADSFAMSYSYRFSLSGDTLRCSSSGSGMAHIYRKTTKVH